MMKMIQLNIKFVQRKPVGNKICIKISPICKLLFVFLQMHDQFRMIHYHKNAILSLQIGQRTHSSVSVSPKLLLKQLL